MCSRGQGVLGEDIYIYINTKYFKDRNTRDHLAWTIGVRGPVHEVCIPHRIPRAWEQQW